MTELHVFICSRLASNILVKKYLGFPKELEDVKKEKKKRDDMITLGLLASDSTIEA